MADLIDGIVNSRTVKRLRENKELTKWSTIVSGVLVVFLLSTLPEYSKRSVSTLTPELQEIDKSLKAARTKTDPFVRERFVQQEAKRLGLTSDDYRKLVAIRKKDSNVLPDAPADLPSKAMWFYQDLSRWQRLLLVWNGGKWLLGGLPNLTILFVGVRFLMEIPRREKEAKYQAWQVVHTAYGQKVSGARIAALEDLNDQGESLGGLTLEQGANLSDICLSRAKLAGADLNGANLSRADLSRAILNGANLNDANLRGANFSNAMLWNAKLEGADLEGANFSNAMLWNAKLEGADLNGANFSNANLSEANLSEAMLWNANLSRASLNEADLSRADLSRADLSGADLSGAILFRVDLSATGFNQAQLEGDQPPFLCHVKLPEGFTVNPHRDCEKLPAILLERYPKQFKDLEKAKAHVDAGIKWTLL